VWLTGDIGKTKGEASTAESVIFHHFLAQKRRNSARKQPFSARFIMPRIADSARFRSPLWVRSRPDRLVDLTIAGCRLHTKAHISKKKSSQLRDFGLT
jgi:hypothetical protein